VQYNKNK